MDYEKKDFRKLYEDLVKSDWFKRAYHNKSLGECPFDIPELAESEDERMYARVTERYTRFEKYYLRALGETEANKVLKQCEEEELWIKNLLEKQKDLDKMIVVSPEVWDKAIADAYENGKKDNEKQKEQKTAEWNDSDMKEARNNLISVCRDWERGEKTTLLPVVAVRARYFLEHLTEPKCAVWSEEDKGLLLSTKCIIDEVWHSENTFGYSKEELEEIWNWLNVAWNRLEYPKENNEWSETDEKNLNEIIHFFESLCSCLATEERHAENRKWLKFLKSLRPSWKPSKEQPKMNIPSAGSGAMGTTPPKFKLDVKQDLPVGLEKEIKEYLEKLGGGHGGFVDDLTDDDLIGFAHHFCELGINARKED